MNSYPTDAITGWIRDWNRLRQTSIHTDPHMRVYGIRKIPAQLNRDGIRAAQCTMERLCADLGVRTQR